MGRGTYSGGSTIIRIYPTANPEVPPKPKGALEIAASEAQRGFVGKTTVKGAEEVRAEKAKRTKLREGTKAAKPPRKGATFSAGVGKKLTAAQKKAKFHQLVAQQKTKTKER